MNIRPHDSTTFGKIKVNVSRMTKEQIARSKKLNNALSACSEYNIFKNKDIDVYILPKQNCKTALEVRYGDPYSGNFIRKNDEIISQTYSKFNSEDAAKEIVNTLDKINDGIIRRPAASKEKLFNGTTEICKINRNYNKELLECKEHFVKSNVDDNTAKDISYSLYKLDYNNFNKNENF